jgi:hypothetical protein
MSAAAVSAFAAALALLAAGACLALFFSTEREPWGRANDATTALGAILLIPPVIDARGLIVGGAPVLLQVATVIAVLGLLTIGVASTMTALGRLAWDRSAKIGGIGFAGFVAWLAVLGVVSLARGGLPMWLAWIGLATAIVVVVAAVVGIDFARRHGTLFEEADPPATLWIAATIAYAGAVAWIVLLGVELA